MKKGLKIATIIVASLVAIILILALVISPIAKNYIENHSKQLVGRTMKMDRLRINIFTGGLKIENFVIYEQNDTDKFVSLGRFETKMRIVPLLSQKFIIQHILLSEADVNVTQRGNKFNFDDIILHFAADSTQTPEPNAKPSPWEIGIYNIAITGSSVLYKDLAVGSEWGLKHLNLKIPGVYFADKSTDIGVNLDFTSGGSLKTNLSYDIQKKTYDLKLALQKFSLEGLLPYLQQSMNVEKIAGMLNAEITVNGNIDHVMDFDMKGSASLSNMLLQDNKGRKVVAVGSADLNMEDFNISKENFLFNSMAIDNLSTEFQVYKDGKNNFSDLMKSTPEQQIQETTNTTPSKMTLMVGDLKLSNSSVTYTDHSLPRAFAYTISDITLTAQNFNPSAHNAVEIRATMQNKGTARIKWAGNMDNLANQNLLINLSNIDLTAFTPYALQYFGYPIQNGNLTFISQNVVNNNMLNGTNKLDIYACELSKRDKQIKPEYKVPLKVGLYILKDKNDRINLDLPVKGNIDSPEFSYKKIILKTLGNVLIKVAAAPFTFMADAMGLGQDKLQSIAISALQHQFNSEQYAKLQELSQIIKSKPEFILTLRQELDFAEAINDYSMANLKMALYMKKNPDKQEKIELIDIDAMMNTSTKSAELTSYADTLLLNKGLPLKGNIQAKAVALFAQKAERQLAESIITRNTLLYSHMVTKLQMPESSFTISTMPLDSMKMYSGKSQYIVGMNLKEDGVNNKKEE